MNRLKRFLKSGIFILFLALSWVFPSTGSARLDLHNAAKQGNFKKVKKLLAMGANINSVSSSGYTPLHISAGWDKRHVTGLLVSKGAEVNARNSSGLTPLHLAAGRGHLKMVKFLLSRGADPWIEDQSGRIPADLARHKSNDRLVDLLESMPRDSGGSIRSFFSSLSTESWYVILGSISALFLGSQVFS